jgi:hypothetical protein
MRHYCGREFVAQEFGGEFRGERAGTARKSRAPTRGRSSAGMIRWIVGASHAVSLGDEGP